MKELSQVFKPKGLLLSTAVSPSRKIINEGYDVSEISKYFDWISVMTYDFHGQWDKKTGHVAPLFSLPDDWEPTFNAVNVSLIIFAGFTFLGFGKLLKLNFKLNFRIFLFIIGWREERLLRN